MILISQNCLSGHLYKLLHAKYAHPFIWTVIDFNSMKNLIITWDKLDFSDFDLIKNDKLEFSIILNKNIKIQYVHYKFDSNKKVPTKNNIGDISYNKIWEYIVEKYIERCKRMLADKSKPLFCIANFNTIYTDAIYTENQLKELEKFENVKILRNCYNDTPHSAAVKFFNKFL